MTNSLTCKFILHYVRKNNSVVYRNIDCSEEMKDFDRVCIYVDNQFQAEDSFTVRNTLTSQSE